MADIDQLADGAVALVATYSKRVLDGLQDRAVDALAAHTLRLLEEAFADDESRRASLDCVRQQPEDERYQQALGTSVADTLQDDEGLVERLEETLAAARAAGFFEGVTVGHADVRIGTMRRSHFSIGPMTINNTRQVRIGLGVAVIAAVAMLSAILGRSVGDDDGDTTGLAGTPPAASGDDLPDEVPPEETALPEEPPPGAEDLAVDTVRFQYGPRDIELDISDCGLETNDDGTFTAFVEAFGASQGGIVAEIDLADGDADWEVYISATDMTFNGSPPHPESEGNPDDSYADINDAVTDGNHLVIQGTNDDGERHTVSAHCSNSFEPPPGLAQSMTGLR